MSHQEFHALYGIARGIVQGRTLHGCLELPHLKVRELRCDVVRNHVAAVATTAGVRAGFAWRHAETAAALAIASANGDLISPPPLWGRILALQTARREREESPYWGLPPAEDPDDPPHNLGPVIGAI